MEMKREVRGEEATGRVGGSHLLEIEIKRTRKEDERE